MDIRGKINGDLDAIMRQFLQEVERQEIESLCRVGEEAVALAKQIPAPIGYKDRTGNLRSSTGYAVFKDGKPINKAFKSVKGATIGAATGEKLAMNLAKNHPTGLALIVVAGMYYAVYVEAKGRDVLTSAETNAEAGAKREFADLLKNINAAFEK